MFIMNKERTVIIKPTTICMVKSEIEGMVNIVASDGREDYVLGTYDIEYANKEFNEIFSNMHYSESEETYKMASDDDVKDYYERKNDFIPAFSIDEDIPF